MISASTVSQRDCLGLWTLFGDRYVHFLFETKLGASTEAIENTLSLEVARLVRFGLTTSSFGEQCVSCLSWKWRKRSSVKIMERTYEERAQALHCGREGCGSEAAPSG